MSRQYQTSGGVEMGGPVGELNRLKSSGGESLAELREFTGRMRGRSPQEVLGLVAASSLVRSTCMAAGGILAALVVLSVVPWMLQNPESATAEAAPTAAAADDEPASDQAQAAATADAGQTAEPTDADAAPADESEQARAERAVEAMGIGEVREAKSGENPLDDSRIDSLLDVD